MFGQFADAASGAARRRASSTATRRCSTRARPGPPGLGLRPRAGAGAARQRRVRAAARLRGRRRDPMLLEPIVSPRPSRPNRARARPARRHAAGQRAGRAGGGATWRRGCAAARPRPSCTSPATGRGWRSSPGMVRFFAPEIEIVEHPGLGLPALRPDLAQRRAHGRAAARPGAAGRRARRSKPRLVLTTANAIVQKVPPPGVVARRARCAPRPAARSRPRRAARLSRAQRLSPHQRRGRGRRLRRARRPGRHLPERPASSPCGSTSSAPRWSRSAASIR